jgi:hypothetical protein
MPRRRNRARTCRPSALLSSASIDLKMVATAGVVPHSCAHMYISFSLSHWLWEKPKSRHGALYETIAVRIFLLFFPLVTSFALALQWWRPSGLLCPGILVAWLGYSPIDISVTAGSFLFLFFPPLHQQQTWQEKLFKFLWVVKSGTNDPSLLENGVKSQRAFFIFPLPCCWLKSSRVETWWWMHFEMMASSTPAAYRLRRTGGMFLPFFIWSLL